MNIRKYNEYAMANEDEGGIPLYDEIDEGIRHQLDQIVSNLRDDNYQVYLDYYQPHHSESGREECTLQIHYSYSDMGTKEKYMETCIDIETRLKSFDADRLSARVAGMRKGVIQNRTMLYAGDDISRFIFDTVTFTLGWNPTDPISYLNEEVSINNKNAKKDAHNILNIARDEGLWAEYIRNNGIGICNTNIGLKDPKVENNIMPTADFIKICENIYTRICQFYNVEIESKSYIDWTVKQPENLSECDDGTYIVFFNLS